MDFRIIGEYKYKISDIQKILVDICSKYSLHILFSDKVIFSDFYTAGFLDFSIWLSPREEKSILNASIYSNNILSDELLANPKYIYNLIDGDFRYYTDDNDFKNDKTLDIINNKLRWSFFTKLLYKIQGSLLENLDEGVTYNLYKVIARDSSIHQEAIRRGLSDIDRTNNGKLLAETAEDYPKDLTGSSEAYPTHYGSHPNYDDAIKSQIDDLIDTNDIDIFNLENMPDEQLNSIINTIENRAINILTDWQPPKLN